MSDCEPDTGCECLGDANATPSDAYHSGHQAGYDKAAVSAYRKGREDAAVSRDQLRAQVISEIAAELVTLADAVHEDGTPVFGPPAWGEGSQYVVHAVAGYVESWSCRPAPSPTWLARGESGDGEGLLGSRSP